MRSSIALVMFVVAALGAACATGNNAGSDTSALDTAPVDTTADLADDTPDDPDVPPDVTDAPTDVVADTDASDPPDPMDVPDVPGDVTPDETEEDVAIDDPAMDDPVEDVAEEDTVVVDVAADTTPDMTGPVYVMSAMGDDCDTRCAALGMTCGGYGTVGLDCGMYVGSTLCSTPGYWIFRTVDGICYNSWGTCDPCTLNYNVYNEFCCKCT